MRAHALHISRVQNAAFGDHAFVSWDLRQQIKRCLQLCFKRAQISVVNTQ